MTARAHTACLLAGFAVLLAGCGGGGSTTTISGRPASANGFTTYQGRHYELSVPPWKPFVNQAATGRISTAWSTPGTGNFVILAIDDPHPDVNLDTAAKTSAQASRHGYHVTKQTVVPAKVPGAKAARLITDYGPHGVGYYRAYPQKDANLIVTTQRGAMINVLVVAHGPGNPDPMSVIDSFRLTG